MGSRRINQSGRNALTGRLRAVRECVLWLLRLRTRHRVVNRSMEPTASSGDFLLVNPRAYRNERPRPGDVVIARHPHVQSRMITKRVMNVADERVELVSDNLDEGQDSRDFGLLPLSLVCGQVTCIIR